MKRLLLIALVALSLTSNAQVDPAFTAKMVSVSNTVKAWYIGGQPSSGTLLTNMQDAVFAFYPISNATFSSKLQAMLGSAVEMSKFSTPTGFVQCLGVAAGQYVACQNAHVESTGHIPYDPTDPPACYDSYQIAIVQCAITHLTR